MPEFVCAMEDTLEVYHRQQDPKRPLVCFDEGSKQLTKETRPASMPTPTSGAVAKYDYEYERLRHQQRSGYSASHQSASLASCQGDSAPHQG